MTCCGISHDHTTPISIPEPVPIRKPDDSNVIVTETEDGYEVYLPQYDVIDYGNELPDDIVDQLPEDVAAAMRSMYATITEGDEYLDYQAEQIQSASVIEYGSSVGVFLYATEPGYGTGAIFECTLVDGKMQSIEDAPAAILRNPGNDYDAAQIRKVVWMDDSGRLHRENGPSVVIRNRSGFDSFRIREIEWWYEGNRIPESSYSLNAKAAINLLKETNRQYDEIPQFVTDFVMQEYLEARRAGMPHEWAFDLIADKGDPDPDVRRAFTKRPGDPF